MRSEIVQKLSEILVRDFQVAAADIAEDAHLRNDLQLDSLALVDLVFLVQKDFGFKAKAEDFQGARTVGAVADVITRKLGGTPGTP